MKITNKFIALSLLGALAAACNPMEDIYNDIDSQEHNITKVEEEYVLTAADYEAISKAAGEAATTDEEKALAAAVKNQQALNAFATADKFVPAVLQSLYPSWGKGSTVGVTYNYQEDMSELMKQMSTVVYCNVANADYEGIWGNSSTHYFSPAHAPEAELPAILKSKYPESAEGQIAYVDYKWDDADPSVTGQDFFVEAFDAYIGQEEAPVALDGWKQVAVKGEKQWSGKNRNNDGYAELTAYKATGDVETWLVSPAVAVSDAAAWFTFDVAFGYYKGDYCLKVYVSDTYSGDGQIDAAEWTEITSGFDYPEKNTGGYTDETNVGEYPLSSYVGKNVYFAFVYVGNGSTATTTVQIDNVKVTSLKVSPSNEKPALMLFAYDGADWKKFTDENVYVLTHDDYQAMGEPGDHDNFSSSINPDGYLPAFLAQNWPYAQNKDSKVIVYKYYDSSSKLTDARASEYVFEQGVWAAENNIVVREKETFLHNGSQWLFDPSITIELVGSDYQILVDWVAENKPDYLDTRYPDNTEFWFGASAHYVNFNVDLNTRRRYNSEGHLTNDDDQDRAYLLQQVTEGCKLILEVKYPDAPAQMNGVDLYYKVRAAVYTSAATLTYEFTFKSLGSGQFEAEGEPAVID